jgi:hypothetical protein
MFINNWFIVFGFVFKYDFGDNNVLYVL